MSEQQEQRPILQRKTTQSIIYVGVLGWTSFFLTSSIWLRSDSQRKDSLNELQQEIDGLSNSLKMGESQLEEKTLTTEQLSEHISSLAEQLKQRQDASDRSIQVEKDKLTALQKKLNAHLLAATDRFSQNADNTSELDFWATSLEQGLIQDQKLIEQLHSRLAEAYFNAGDTEKTKLHLKLSNHYNKEQEQRLLSQLDINLAMDALQASINEKQSVEQFLSKVKIVDSLIAQLKTNSEKKEEAEKFISTLFSLERAFALASSPSDKVKLFTQFSEKQQKQATSLSLKLSYLETLKTAALVATALEQSSSANAFTQQSDNVVKEILKISPKQPQAAMAKAELQLLQLDLLFSQGEPAELKSAISDLNKTLRLLKKTDASIIKSAIRGHEAATYYERGQTTQALNVVGSAIKSLQKLTNDEPKNALAHYRLGILHWQKAQLTSADDVNFDSLKQASASINSALADIPSYYSHSVRRFLAMVEGDLGELSSTLGNKKAAKVHYQNALTQWNAIEKEWMQSEESKEGIRYCSWKIKSL